MKHLLLTTIAAVVLVGCGESKQSTPAPEAKPAEPVTEAESPTKSESKSKAMKANLLKGKWIEFGDTVRGGPETWEFHENGTVDIIDEGKEMAGKYEVTPPDTVSMTVFGMTISAKISKSGDEITSAFGKYKKEGNYQAELKPVEPVAEAAKPELTIERVVGKFKRGFATLIFDKNGTCKAMSGAIVMATGTWFIKDGQIHTVSDDARKNLVIYEMLDNGNLKHPKGDVAKRIEAVAKAPVQPSPPPVEAKPDELVSEAAQPKLPTAKAPDASLWEAAMFGEIDNAKKAIAAGASVNAKKDDGETPLHWATVEAMDSGSKKVIELLISKGADVNAKIMSGRKKGMTSLAIVNMFSNKEIADLLRKHGAKMGAELKSGKPKFYYDMAAIKGEGANWPGTLNSRVFKKDYSDLNDAQFIDKLFAMMEKSEGKVHAFVLVYKDRTQKEISYATGKALNHPYEKPTSSTG